jgi:hypothetical protein
MVRTCTRCGETKNVDEFAWRNIARGKRDGYCRTCRAAYKQEHYAKNRARYIANAARRNARELERRTRYLLDFLRTHPCVDCGETDPIVLEFDHLTDKLFNVSTGLRDRAWASVLAEMEKCEVVCANCHRRRSALRGGYLRAMVARQVGADAPPS